MIEPHDHARYDASDPPDRADRLRRLRGQGADLLAEALSGLGAEPAPAELIAGLAPPDDAAVYRVSDDLAIIGTLDFFPPLVDDARTYGEIAAANALSDVFAMGGRVLFALSIAAFPEASHATPWRRCLTARRPRSARRAAPSPAATIRDPEPKYGLAVIGAAHPDRLLRKGGARPGDRLLLTKRLGTGVLVSGSRQGGPPPNLATAIDQMRALNRAASEALLEAGVTAATDVTGFGLLGHGLEMARASVPAAPSTPRPADPRRRFELAASGVETGGAAHNRRFVADALTVADEVAPELVTLAHDPQTSGGLLAAVPAERVAAVEAALTARTVEHWWVGSVDDGAGIGTIALG